MVEDQAQGVGQNANQGEQDQGTGLMDGGLLEMGLGGEGLKGFRLQEYGIRRGQRVEDGAALVLRPPLFLGEMRHGVLYPFGEE